MKILITALLALLLASPVMAVEIAADAFAGTANPLGGDWTTIPGGLGDLQKASGIVRGTATSSRNGAYNVTAVGDDQYSQATIISAVGGNAPCVAVRISASDESYYAFCPIDAGGDAWDLFKQVSGAYTSLSSDFNAWAPGDVIKIEAQGTAIRGYINGALVASATDSSVTTGQFGIVLSAGGTLTDTEIDDWSGGDFAPPAASGDFFARRRR